MTPTQAIQVDQAALGTAMKHATSPVLPITPPASETAVSDEEYASEGDLRISVSTTFYPGNNLSPKPCDLALLSADRVFFYVHSDVLDSASQTRFANLLPAVPAPASGDPVIVMVAGVTSDALNVVLHTVYSLSCAHFAPSRDTLASALNAMERFGVPLRAYVASNTPLFNLLLAHAPAAPLALYALAAMHGLEELAVALSPHLLSVPLHSLTDEQALAIGAVFLKRLFCLQLARNDALKRLILAPPSMHPPTIMCDDAAQKALGRAWSLASAYIIFEARPDMPCSTLQSTLAPLMDHLRCEQCRDGINGRIKTIIGEWSQVKRTI